MSDQLSLAAGTQKRELSQWFTPTELAKKIAGWALEPLAAGKPFEELHVLEPSAGRGALANALRRLGPHVTCIEIDDENACVLESVGHFVLCEDFLESSDYDRYELAVMNPPFEGGQTERHIMHALKFADRVVCHCPLTTLEGKARRENLWSKVQLHRLAICSSRPKYGAGSGATAMCTIDVTLLDPREKRDATDIDWWP